jgi:hypothetical protein
MLVCLNVCLLLGSGGVFFGVSSFGSVTMAAAKQWGNNGVVFFLGSALRVRCRGKILLLVQPELQKGEFVRSRHAQLKELKTGIKWKKSEMEYTPFLSLLCPWRLDWRRAGQPGLDSSQGQDVSLLQWVPGALSRGVETFADYNYLYMMP